VEKQKTFSCEFCNKSFKREKTLFTHACEQRRRYNSQNDKPIKIAFATYHKFYKAFHQIKNDKTFKDFAKSPYYIGFVKYGNFCVNTRVINVNKFTDYVLKYNIPLERWASDNTYTRYLEYMIRAETVNDALTRSITQCINYGEETNTPPENALKNATNNRIMHWILDARVSPWMIYNSKTGNEFMSNISSEQLQLIWNIIDPDFWHTKFQKYPEDVAFAKKVLTAGGW